MTKPDIAAARFDEGCNCAQAVLGAYCEEYGLDLKTATKLAAPLGGGIGCTGETCGAVTGALMVLGLRECSAEQGKEAKGRAYALAGEFLRRFQKQHGTVRCKELLGHDISAPEGMQAARDSGVMRTICPRAVRGAAEIVDEMLTPNAKA